MSKKYVIIQWPESQALMSEKGFREHSCLINDEPLIDEVGSSAYFVEEDWLKKQHTNTEDVFYMSVSYKVENLMSHLIPIVAKNIDEALLKIQKVIDAGKLDQITEDFYEEYGKTLTSYTITEETNNLYYNYNPKN